MLLGHLESRLPPPRWRWRSLVFGNRAPLGIFTHNPVELKFGCWMHLSPHQSSNSKRPASRTFLCALSYPAGAGLTQRASNRARLSSKDGRRTKTRQAASSLQPAGSRLDHGHRRHLASLMLDGRHFRYRCQANDGGPVRRAAPEGVLIVVVDGPGVPALRTGLGSRRTDRGFVFARGQA
jgi:hypothetical protein